VKDWTRKIDTAHAIIARAVAEWRPVAVVSLYSGGYDSAVATHVAYHRQRVPVWSIDTRMSADGWSDYVTATAAAMGWDHAIYSNDAGYKEFETWVAYHGAPRGEAGHSRAYQRLKERAIYRILMQCKTKHTDKVLFLTGIRKAESTKRNKIATESRRNGHSNIIFVNPILDWSDNDVTNYRWDHEIPENPFYSTVRGSGDCQCNWGNFITARKLQQHAPILWAERVSVIDRISREKHGYGWDGELEGQSQMFDDDGEICEGLCSNCSRDKGGIVEAQEWRALQEQTT
jgi:3'-phosphoadenosine 5'-phosphosulfate sulfotransferase (PAPS reductase)/FAD synthetase